MITLRFNYMAALSTSTLSASEKKSILGRRGDFLHTPLVVAIVLFLKFELLQNNTARNTGEHDARSALSFLRLLTTQSDLMFYETVNCFLVLSLPSAAFPIHANTWKVVQFDLSSHFCFSLVTAHLLSVCPSACL